MNPNAPRYSNIVGTEAQVTHAIVADGEGEVRWSGTLMRARAADAQSHAVGAVVVVRALEGNVLQVATRD